MHCLSFRTCPDTAQTSHLCPLGQILVEQPCIAQERLGNVDCVLHGHEPS